MTGSTRAPVSLRYLAVQSTDAAYDARVLAERLGLPVLSSSAERTIFALGDLELVVEQCAEGDEGTAGQVRMGWEAPESALAALEGTDVEVVMTGEDLGDGLGFAAVRLRGGPVLELLVASGTSGTNP